MDDELIKRLEESKFEHEINVSSFLEQELNPKEGTLNDEQKAEHWAFNFCPDYTDKTTSWGKYYGPLFVLPNGNGQMVEFPSINLLNTNILNHWKYRAETSTNPILLNRYADLFFEFSETKDYAIIAKIVDSAIAIAQNNLQAPIYIKEKLERALQLCFVSNNKDLFQKLAKEIVSLDLSFKGDDSPGLWGFALRLLVIENNKKDFALDFLETQELIKNLEERLVRLRATNDVYCIEHCVINLADYYKKYSLLSDLERVLNILYSEYKKFPEYNENQFSRGHYVDKLRILFSEYNNYDFVKSILQKVDSDLNEIPSLPEMQLQEISAETKISNEDIEKYKSGIFYDDIEKTLMHIAILHVVRKDSVEKSFKDSLRNHVFQHVANRSKISEFGTISAKFKDISTDEGYDTSLMDSFATHYVKFNDFFLKIIIDELKKRYQEDFILENIMKSPVFKEEDSFYLKRIIKALYENDYLVVSTLSIPIIESGIRNIFLLNNRSIFTYNKKTEGSDVKSISTLLKDELIDEIYKNTKVDVRYYLRACLTDSYGLSFRDDFAHGLNKKGFTQEFSANRLFHIILVLSLVRLVETITPYKQESALNPDTPPQVI